jgi:hypothetical protein
VIEITQEEAHDWIITLNKYPKLRVGRCIISFPYFQAPGRNEIADVNENGTNVVKFLNHKDDIEYFRKKGWYISEVRNGSCSFASPDFASEMQAMRAGIIYFNEDGFLKELIVEVLS